MHLDDGQRRARLLYIDPLHPDDVPAAVLALLNLPFPGIEVEHCVLQYQDDGILGQHSCGAWAVALAEYLVTHAHALPDVADNPRTAANTLREEHNPLLATAHDHPWPEAPAALLHVHGPQGPVHVADMPRLLLQIPDGRRSPDKPASLGDLMRKGKSSPDDHF